VFALRRVAHRRFYRANVPWILRAAHRTMKGMDVTPSAPQSTGDPTRNDMATLRAAHRHMGHSMYLGNGAGGWA